jgi:DHA2 family multidrug resistance protein
MRRPSRYAIALTAALGLFPVALDSTIVNVGIVPISKALSSDVTTIQWIFLGYLLANAAVVSLGGYLANRYGIKRLFVLGIGLFTLCSFLCGLAPSEAWLIACRVAQGVGGGLLMPLGIAIALAPFAREERAKASALVGVPVLLAPVLGPIAGGIIIDRLNWQAMFFINVPIGLLAAALALAVLPGDEQAVSGGQHRFDYAGLVLSMLGTVALVYAFKLVGQTNPATRTALHPQGEIYGWGYAPVWALIAVGLAALALFAVHALRTKDGPVLDLRLFRRRDFTLGSAVTWAASIVTFGVLFLIPVYLQEVRLPNLSALDTGLTLLPLGVATLAGVVLGGGLYRKSGARPLVVVGGGLFALSFWGLSRLTPTTATGDLWPWLALLGLSITLTAVPAQTLALEAPEGPALNTATSLVNATKLLFGSVGSAILVTMFIQRTTAHGAQLQAALLHHLPAATLPAQHSPQFLALRAHLAAQAATSGMTDVFGLLVWASLLLVLLGLALPGRLPRVREDQAGAPLPARASQAEALAAQR